MSDTYTPQAAAEQARDAFRKAAKEFEALKIDTTVPESVRALAEKTVNQSREAYERGRSSWRRPSMRWSGLSTPQARARPPSIAS